MPGQQPSFVREGLIFNGFALPYAIVELPHYVHIYISMRMYIVCIVTCRRDGTVKKMAHCKIATVSSRGDAATLLAPPA